MATTIGRLMVQRALPKDTPSIDAPIGSDELTKILEHIIQTQPDKYKAITHQLNQLGGAASFEEGTTLTLEDAENASPNRDMLVKHVAEQQKKIQATDVTQDEKDQALAKLYGMVHKQITDENYDTALAAGNMYARQVASKARGSKMQLSNLMSTPGSFTDGKGRVIPIFIGRSYAEGLRPDEYWAALYGARKGVVSTKFATPEGGELGKQLMAAAMRTVVTDDDCETPNGIPVKTEDADNVGSVLARAAGGVPAGTILTRPVLDKLKTQHDQIVVRSPITCGLDKGVCRYCTGVREKGTLPDVGDYVGVNAASALAERVAQGALNVKHQGGAGSGAKGGIDEDLTGFKYVEQLTQVPKSFQRKATLSTLPGRIEKIEKAEQGGHYITVGGEQHYVLPGHELSVKEGDDVEPGDALSSGLINPAEIVQYKGLGEGRRYFTERLTDMMRKSGWTTHRRNSEIMARAMMDTVTLDDDTQGLPGDVQSYNRIAFNYKPRPEAKTLGVKSARGMYLEQPIMHYTVGTKIDSHMADTLGKFGISDVVAHPEPPGFTPYMEPLRFAGSNEDDWMAQMGSTYLKSNLLSQAHRAGESSTSSLHPYPSIAKGVPFGSDASKAL